MVNDSSESITAMQRHEKYYISGGDLFFLVERDMYRVHRYFFERESSYFHKLLIGPVSPGAPRRGSEESPLMLEDVRSQDFTKFLWVFYNERYSLYDATVDDWSSILALAHRWSFPQVKSLVIRELEKLWMPDIDRIVLYHKYNIDRRLLISSYAALCEREKFVTLDEGLLLGMETVLRLSRARECARNSSGSRSPSRAGLDSTEMHDIVKEHFGIGGGTENQNGNHDNQASTGGSVTLSCGRGILRSDSYFVQEAATQSQPTVEVSPTEQPPGETGLTVIVVETIPQSTGEPQLPEPPTESQTESPKESPTEQLPEEAVNEPEVDSEPENDEGSDSGEESETVRGEEESVEGQKEDDRVEKEGDKDEAGKDEPEGGTEEMDGNGTVSADDNVQTDTEPMNNISVAQGNDTDHTVDSDTPEELASSVEGGDKENEASLDDASTTPTVPQDDTGNKEGGERGSDKRIFLTKIDVSDNVGDEDDDDDNQSFYDSPEGPEPPVSIENLLS